MANVAPMGEGGAGTVRCEGCNVAVPAGELRLDTEARRLCRKCHALVLVGEGDALHRKEGALRRCRRCDGFTLRVGEPVETEVYGYAPGYEGSAPMAVGHRFRCAHCRGSVFLLTPMGMLVAAFVAFVIGAGLREARGGWVGPILAAALFAMVILREVVLRRLHPAQ